VIKPFGRIIVSTPGVPVPVTALQTDAINRLNVHAVLIQALSSNTGKVYIGTRDINRSTLAGVYAVLAVPTPSVIPTFSAALTLAPAGIQVQDMYLDVDLGGEGALVTVLIT